MPLRFFADHCIADAVIQQLQSAGYEVLRLKDHLPIESSDRVVITTAQKLNSILLSLNGDFTDILNYPPSRYKGTISLQVRNHPEITPQLMERLLSV
jgi:predicted nuclease of predicted toxin-antitoxin system